MSTFYDLSTIALHTQKGVELIPTLNIFVSEKFLTPYLTCLSDFMVRFVHFHYTVIKDSILLTKIGLFFLLGLSLCLCFYLRSTQYQS